MTTILLLNPNTSARSLRMMLDIATPWLPPGMTLRGIGATSGARMIVSEADLLTAAREVARLGVAEGTDAAGIVVSAFADPGAEVLRDAVRVPVVGIGAASIVEAAAGGRRFGIATTTPGLARPIEALVDGLAVRGSFTGMRVAAGDPLELAEDEARQEWQLARAVRACIEVDGAEAVIIGGGPLSAAARSLRGSFAVEIVEPVPAAMRAVLRLLGRETPRR